LADHVNAHPLTDLWVCRTDDLEGTSAKVSIIESCRPVAPLNHNNRLPARHAFKLLEQTSFIPIPKRDSGNECG